jgi:hypothetical protein
MQYPVAYCIQYSNQTMTLTHFFVLVALFLTQCVLESMSFIQRFRFHHSTRLEARNTFWNNIPEPYNEVLWENGEIAWDFPQLDTNKNDTKNGNETDSTLGVQGVPPTDPNRPIPFTKKGVQEKPQINIKLPLYTRISSHELRMAYV